MNSFNSDAFRRLGRYHLIPSLQGNKAAYGCEYIGLAVAAIPTLSFSMLVEHISDILSLV